jgi:hypothetical protein
MPLDIARFTLLVREVARVFGAVVFGPNFVVLVLEVRETELAEEQRRSSRGFGRRKESQT